MGDKGWKKFERRCARDMGTERIPVTGERDGADCSTDLFAFQFKVRAKLPEWLWTWLAGITGHAEAKGKVGVLVLKQPRRHDDGALVVLRWKDWVALHGTQQMGDLHICRQPGFDASLHTCLGCADQQ